MVATQACPCTKIAQDETCPVGFPSLLCDMCNSKGVVPYIKLDGPELWEIVFGTNSDAASSLSDDEYQKIASDINAVFITPLRAEIEASSPSELPLGYPEKLTDNLSDALSLMMWKTGPIARVLRIGGADIPRKAELEQAHVLHWATHLVLKHGDDWRKMGGEQLKSIRDAANAEAMRFCGLAKHEVP